MVKNYKEYLNDNFWKWFGDSKVVDNEGNPLVVYHGTNKDFSEFKSTKFATAGYFAKDPQLASHISKLVGHNSNVVPVYLSIKNPLDLSHIETGYDDIHPSELIKQIPIKLDDNFKEKLLKFSSNPLFTYIGDIDFINYFKSKGYDGFIFHELMVGQNGYEMDGEFIKLHELDTGLTYVPFYPEQIKSAIGNNGNFNPNSTNINENTKQKPKF